MFVQQIRGRSIRLVLPGLVFLLSGCIDSEAPLSDPDKAAPDEKLLGKWIHEDKGFKPVQFTIEKVAAPGYPTGIMKLTCRRLAKTDQETPQVGFVFRSELKGKTYLNLCGKMVDELPMLPPWNKVRANGFRIFKYSVKEHTLTFWFVDDESVLKTAVMHGKLNGTIRPMGYLDFEPTVRLKDTTANLARFLASEDEKLFSGRKKLVLTRAK
ncbi:MAG TPA: hypothetical protein VKE98_23930 [Gemmataceae bacterium]|nr:hypothetical protein [Gemmataceae bacterium]